MYFYIFDPGSPEEIKYFEQIQGRLLNALAENQIEGETYRVTAIRTIPLLIEQALGLEAKTIIIVGSDSSLNRAINALVRRKADLTLGFISLDSKSNMRQILGMPLEATDAVKTLAGRLISRLDLGKIGEHFFLTALEFGHNFNLKRGNGLWGVSRVLPKLWAIKSFVVKLLLEDSYTVTAEILGGQIINLRSNENCRQKLGNPVDGVLDVLLLHKLSTINLLRHRKELSSGCLDNVPGATVMHTKKIEILAPKKLPLSAESQILTKAPAAITVAREKIKMIVGKGRQF